MKGVEKLVKDKALFYWLDIEISLFHIVIYWILALLIDDRWAFWMAGILSFWSLVYIGKVSRKLEKLKDQD